MLKCFCPDHLLHFVVLFLLNVAIYAFNFLFSCINLRASFQDMTQGVGKGKGQANPMWTQWRNVDPDGKNDGWGNNELKEGNIS